MANLIVKRKKKLNQKKQHHFISTNGQISSQNRLDEHFEIRIKFGEPN